MVVDRPAPGPVLRRLEANGIELALVEWHADRRGEGPTLLLAHATGHHARCWDAVIRRLGARHVIAVDQRGHGRSARVAIDDWRVFGEDLGAVLRALDLGEVVGVGHSMGGHAMIDAAAAQPARFVRLVLLDPVVVDPAAYEASRGRSVPDEPLPIAKRRRGFASADEMFERFVDREPYVHFTREALRDYCEHGLLPAAEGGLELACLPEVEARIYLTSLTGRGVHDRARSVEVPTLVVRARRPPDRRPMDFATSPTWPALASVFPRGRDLHLAEHTHFLPQEDPDRIASLLLDELEGAATGAR